MKIIQIAGTNGKGSVATYAAALLQGSGYKTGLFTSPHILQKEERIRINGEYIPQKDMDALFERAQGNYFTKLTQAAMEWFGMNGAECAVLEVGLGGRLDPTCRYGADVNVITRIGIDHVKILGDTIEQIAFEKAGIICRNGRVVTQPQAEGAMGVIKQMCEVRNAALHVVSEGLDLNLRSLGASQPLNAALALRAVELLGVKADAKLLEGVSVPARLEYYKERDMLLDGGHNADAISELISCLSADFADRRLVLLTASMRGKDEQALASYVKKRKAEVVATSVQSSRSRSAEETAELFGARFALKDSKKAFALAKQLAEENKAMLVVAGSFYLAGEILELFKQL